jgi:hypothetical protein
MPGTAELWPEQVDDRSDESHQGNGAEGEYADNRHDDQPLQTLDAGQECGDHGQTKTACGNVAQAVFFRFHPVLTSLSVGRDQAVNDGVFQGKTGRKLASETFRKRDPT